VWLADKQVVYDCDSPSEASRRFRRDLLRRVQEELYAEAEQIPSPVEQQLLQRVAQIVRRCEHDLLNQSHPPHNTSFNTDRRASASSIGSSYQATPASALSPPTSQSHPPPVAPVSVLQDPVHGPMTLQDTAQYIPELPVDIPQVVWDDESYNTFGLGIDWDDVFPCAPSLQYRSGDGPVTAFSKPMWT
jgi:hypothetical protein